MNQKTLPRDKAATVAPAVAPSSAVDLGPPHTGLIRRQSHGETHGTSCIA